MTLQQTILDAMHKFLFPQMHRWLTALPLVILAGFYPSYFGKLGEPLPTVYHVHAGLMMIWVSLGIIQPWLIYSKKTRIHRSIGRLSYLIMPLIWAGSWWMMRHVYVEQSGIMTAAAATESPVPTAIEISNRAANYTTIGWMYLGWLMLFYLLAVYYRRRMAAHGTFMLAAVFTVLGPSVDRLLYRIFDGMGPVFMLIAQYGVMSGILIFFAALAWYQHRKGTTPRYALAAWTIYALGIIAYIGLPHTDWWPALVRRMLAAGSLHATICDPFRVGFMLESCML